MKKSGVKGTGFPVCRKKFFGAIVFGHLCYDETFLLKLILYYERNCAKKVSHPLVRYTVE